VLSHTVEYALRATLYIARQQPRSVRLPEVADAAAAPPRYLAKILGQLARAGILNSVRGPAGGFTVAANKRTATLSDIVEVFEKAEPRRCLLGNGMCGSNPDCSVHERWLPIATSMSELFDRTTIADLLSSRTPPQR
jgi:Rrf2 family iron-sulfur cluster assembly transcriptional regulator